MKLSIKKAMNDPLIKILLIEDDEDDYIILRDLLSRIQMLECQVDWASTADMAFDMLNSGGYNICLLDFVLGDINGVEFLDLLREKRFDIPVIILTGYGDHKTDLTAMQHGAIDYLEKADLTSVQLERSIRYAINTSKIVNDLKKSEEKLRILSGKILEAQEEERKSLALELHDSIGSGLTGILYAFEQTIDNLEFRPKAKGKSLSFDQLREMIKDIIDETQRISSNLRPSTLDALGILPAIRSLCKKFKDIYKDTELIIKLEIKEDDIPKKLKIVLYRIIQEALNNAAKYSEAKKINLGICLQKDYLELTVEDDGKGISKEDSNKNEYQSKSIGIEGMIERAELSGGELKIYSEWGRGTAIRARFPIR